jgi:4-carboxymuconolactone decarboxylase
MAAARIPLVIPGDDPARAGVENAIVEARGRISPLYQALLNSPPVAAGWEALLTAVRNRSSLDPALRELVILRVAVLNGAPFEYQSHLPHARAAGLTDAKIDAVSAGPAEPIFEERERIALEYADAMTRDIAVPDELYARVHARFGDRKVVELTVTIAAYNMVSRFLVALRIGFPDAPPDA